MNKNMPSQYRWQTLDIIKTIGCLGAIFSHILIWQFGTTHRGVGIDLYDMNAVSWPILTFCFVIVHILFLSAGASFYFYIEKYHPSMRQVGTRLIPIILLGFLFGLNYHPFILYWNVFFFYTLSILTLFFLQRFFGYTIIFLVTSLTLFLTPLLRMFFDDGFLENYFITFFFTDAQNTINFYPFFPFFSLIGFGFLTSHIYYTYQKKKLFIRSLASGTLALFFLTLILERVDVSDIFGVTAHLPIRFLLLTIAFFVVILSLIELIAHGRMITKKYHPLVIIGRHILPVYVLTLLSSLVFLNFFQRLSFYNKESIGVFLFSLFITFDIAYAIAVILTYRNRQNA
ncbi:MAG: hypothetical protein PHH40_00095 [Candidatus Moranbacteria bacterium]|nr:hypothetical protein [Candidatus Moranbacteria bacterium]MDD3965270.1 hypothetical protein [Candidatus Moranbacteria bacterium]